MKKLLMIGLSLALVFGASAQRGHIGGGGYHYGGGFYGGPRVSLGFGFGGYNPYGGFYSPYFGYPFGPFGYGNGYGYNRPSKLAMKVADIKNDYADKIWSAKQDKSLTHRQRRQTIRNLKNERDQQIEDLRANYYKQ